MTTGSHPRILWNASYIHFEMKKHGYTIRIGQFVQRWGVKLCELPYLEVDRDVIWNPAAAETTVDMDADVVQRLNCVIRIKANVE